MTISVIRFLVLAALLAMPLFFTACKNGKNEVKKVEKKVTEEKKEFNVIEPTYDVKLPGEEGIKNTIRAYNEALAQVHMSDPYLGVLRKFATDKEVQKIFVEDRFNTERGVALRSWMKELVFEEVSVSGDKGLADTSEMWEFDYIDIKTKNVVEPRQKVSYKLRYQLVREEDHWVVSEIKERQPRVFE